MVTLNAFQIGILLLIFVGALVGEAYLVFQTAFSRGVVSGTRMTRKHFREVRSKYKKEHEGKESANDIYWMDDEVKHG